MNVFVKQNLESLALLRFLEKIKGILIKLLNIDAPLDGGKKVHEVACFKKQ